MSVCTIVIFGASGDLAKRKLIPAIYRLIKDKDLTNYIIIGVALDEITADEILENTKEFIKDIDDTVFSDLKSHFYYEQLNFKKPEDFSRLKDRIDELETTYKLPGNRLLYCAAASEFYCNITQNVCNAGIAAKHDKKTVPWQRIVYEKPFGSDLSSAREINSCIKEYFNESQVFRIDHYLTKELVNNIALVRFTNIVFQPLWNHHYIDEVQIIFDEKLGLEGRGGYYDNYGALSDVVQNHMLELMALIGMEAPEKLSGDYIRDKRAAVLKDIKVVGGILGQVSGYDALPDVKKESKTETFAALSLRIDNERWKGVPFYLKTGKFLDKKRTVIYIKFKKAHCLLETECPIDPNWLRIEVSPEAIFSLQLNAKKPGATNELMPVSMDFCHSCLYGPQTPEAYELLLEEVLKGEQSIVVRFDEIEYAWNVIDTIREMALPLYEYKKGSQGPDALKEFEQKNDMRWKE